MRIRNVRKGQDYQLAEGTRLEIDRTNLFFNEYGEQSWPLSLPDSPANRAILDEPQSLANVNKPDTDMEAIISHGGYFALARQVVLGSYERESLSTVFYLNEGAFLSRVKKVGLKDVFGDGRVAGVRSVNGGILHLLAAGRGEDSEMVCGCVTVDDGSWTLGGVTFDLIPLNEYSAGSLNCSLPRTVHYSDGAVTVAPGFYATPFLRVGFVLERICGHFGYTLGESFLTRDEPFTSLCLLNTTCDTLVNGSIRYGDLLPDVTCDEFLEAIRKKFFCEFVVDEGARTVSVRTFNEALDMAAVSLDGSLIDRLELEYPEAYRELVLSAQSLNATGAAKSAEGVKSVLSDYPAAGMTDNGAMWREGFTYSITETGGDAAPTYTFSAQHVSAYVAGHGMGYKAGSGLEKESVDMPDVIPQYISVGAWQMDKGSESGMKLCAGKARWRNSLIKEERYTSDGEIRSDEDDLPVMFAFFTPGSTTQEPVIGLSKGGYSLALNGEQGIFEKFYRRYDTLLRNSLATVRCSLLLSDSAVSALDVHAPVRLKGQKLLVNRLSYSLGEGREPSELEAYTTRLYEPLDEAETPTALLPDTGYVWKGHVAVDEIDEATYEGMDYKDLTVMTVWPDVRPTSDLAGGTYYEREWGVKFTWRDSSWYGKARFWLTVELSS